MGKVRFSRVSTRRSQRCKSSDEETFQRGLEFAEYLLNVVADGAKFYLGLCRPLDEPLIRGLDAWADAQCWFV